MSAPARRPRSGPRPGFGAALARTRTAQKSPVGAAAYSRWVNRPAGRVLASLAYVVGATPNQVTAVSSAVTAVGLAGIAVLRPTWPVTVGCALALLVGYALDSADGQLARLRGGGSMAGEWLDHVGDAVKEPGLHLVILISWYRHAGLAAAWLLVPVAFTLVSSTLFFSVVLTDQMRRLARATGMSAPAAGPAADPTAPGAPRASVLRSIAVAPGDYGVFSLAVVLLPVTGVFVGLYTALLAAWVVLLLGGWRRWFRELSALTP